MGGDEIAELIDFAKEHHPGFTPISNDFLRKMFITYADTTIINRKNGKIHGFACYQEWPDLLNFICIVGIGSPLENLADMLKYSKQLPKKRICFFNETVMEVKELCHNTQSRL